MALSKLQKRIREEHENDTGLELNLTRETQALCDGLALALSDRRLDATEVRWLIQQVALVDAMADRSLSYNQAINGMYARLVGKEATPTTTTIPFPALDVPKAA